MRSRSAAPREVASEAAGPTLHAYTLEWVDHYAGRGANDVINDRTRREYRRLLVKYALAYFPPDERLRDIDERRARAFVEWLCQLERRKTDTGSATARSAMPRSRCNRAWGVRREPG